MESHNAHVSSLLSKTIQVPQYDKSIKFLHIEARTTFAKWLSECVVSTDRLFVAVETSKPHYIRTIYGNQNHHSVLSVMNNLHQNMVSFFGKEVADDILGTQHTYAASMPSTTKEASYFSSLASSYEANPQDVT